MNNYTVLLLYPDWLSGGIATYLGYGTGTLAEAVAQVRQQAADANNHDQAHAFAVLAVFAGRHQDIKPED